MEYSEEFVHMQEKKENMKSFLRLKANVCFLKKLGKLPLIKDYRGETEKL